MKAIFNSAMFVCVCKAVTEGEVRACIREGATTVDEVGHACGAGTDCGSCIDLIDDLIAEAVPASRRRVALPIYSAAE